MYALVGLAIFVAVVELIAIFGWGADSRDGRDWTPAAPSRGRHGATHLARSRRA
jgi:hypothetical protein